MIDRRTFMATVAAAAAGIGIKATTQPKSAQLSPTQPKSAEVSGSTTTSAVEPGTLRACITKQRPVKRDPRNCYGMPWEGQVRLEMMNWVGKWTRVGSCDPYRLECLVHVISKRGVKIRYDMDLCLECVRIPYDDVMDMAITGRHRNIDDFLKTGRKQT